MLMNRPHVTIHTDGSYKKETTIGGWAAHLSDGVSTELLFDRIENTTNNRMELLAVIESLSVLTTPCNVTVVSDSRYVIDGSTKWIHNWRRNGWVTAKDGEVVNKDLWLRLDKLLTTHNVVFKWIKGHQTGHKKDVKINNLVDYFAGAHFL